MRNGVKKFCQEKSAVQGDNTVNIAYRRRTNLHRNTDYQIRTYHQEEPWPFWRGGSIEVVNLFLLPAKWTLVFNVEYETGTFSVQNFKACLSRQLHEYTVWKWTVYCSSYSVMLTSKFTLIGSTEAQELGLVVVINYKWSSKVTFYTKKVIVYINYLWLKVF